MSNESQSSVVPPEPPPVRTADPERVFYWLKQGWHDLRAAGRPSLLHGLLVVVLSLAILATTLLRWELVMIAASCFVFIGPFLATGLYAISKSLSGGGRPSVTDAVNGWLHASKCLFRFGLLLVFACVVWVAFSLAMFYFFVNVRITDPAEFLRYVLTQHDGLFLLWSILGGLYAALAFSVTVVTMPLLVDRDVTLWLAIRTSVRAVGENPVTMLWWAMVILGLTGVSFASGMLGFLVLYPLMGHASWHVYSELVDASDLPTYTTVE
jgi:uncharacterized membrane protein